MYFQQNRILASLQFLANTVIQQPSAEEFAAEFADAGAEVAGAGAEPDLEPEAEPEAEDDAEAEDDRVSVEHVSGPPAPVTVSEETAESESGTDVDDVQQKTAPQLREMLSKRGIPFGKRDAKTVLIQLLKATA
jgi:hypothetical protein